MGDRHSFNLLLEDCENNEKTSIATEGETVIMCKKGYSFTYNMSNLYAETVFYAPESPFMHLTVCC